MLRWDDVEAESASLRVDPSVYPRLVELTTHAEGGNRQPAEACRLGPVKCLSPDRRQPQDHIAVAFARLRLRDDARIVRFTCSNPDGISDDAALAKICATVGLARGTARGKF